MNLLKGMNNRHEVRNDGMLNFLLFDVQSWALSTTNYRKNSRKIKKHVKCSVINYIHFQGLNFAPRRPFSPRQTNTVNLLLSEFVLYRLFESFQDV